MGGSDYMREVIRVDVNAPADPQSRKPPRLDPSVDTGAADAAHVRYFGDREHLVLIENVHMLHESSIIHDWGRV